MLSKILIILLIAILIFILHLALHLWVYHQLKKQGLTNDEIYEIINQKNE